MAHTSRGWRCVRHIFDDINRYPDVTNVERRDAGAEAFTGKVPVPRRQALECGSGFSSGVARWAAAVMRQRQR